MERWKCITSSQTVTVRVLLRELFGVPQLLILLQNETFIVSGTGYWNNQ
jgi:hypothetical protein